MVKRNFVSKINFQLFVLLVVLNLLFLLFFVFPMIQQTVSPLPGTPSPEIIISKIGLFAWLFVFFISISIFIKKGKWEGVEEKIIEFLERNGPAKEYQLSKELNKKRYSGMDRSRIKRALKKLELWGKVERGKDKRYYLES